MPDYISNEIVDIILVIEECNNYWQAAALYRNWFPYRHDIQIIDFQACIVSTATSMSKTTKTSY